MIKNIMVYLNYLITFSYSFGTYSFKYIKIDHKQGNVDYLLSIDIKSINYFNIQKPKKAIKIETTLLQELSQSERSTTMKM